jgi:hypothetical protein
MVAAPLCLFGVRAHVGSDVLVDCIKVLHSYAITEGFYDDWIHWVNRDLAVMLLIWMSAMASRIGFMFMLQDLPDCKWDVWSAIFALPFAMNSFVVLGAASCVLFLVRGMTLAVDMYCTRLIRTGSLESASFRWNVVRSTLRKASESVQLAMYVLEVAIVFTLALAFLDIYFVHSDFYANDNSTLRLSLLIPVGIVMLGIGRIFIKAAEVSDRCNRVPPLLSSCMGDQCSVAQAEQRDAVVQYVINSAAGFYLHEILLTSGLVIKLTYLSAVALFALVTNFFS